MSEYEGRRFGRLTVIARAANLQRHTLVCRCDCGEWAAARLDQLQAGHTTSCGCAQKEHARKAGAPYRFHRRDDGWITYSTAHRRLHRGRGSASAHPCVTCGATAKEWAYRGDCADEMTGEQNGSPVRYCPEGDRHDCYEPKCIPCHRRADRRAA